MPEGVARSKLAFVEASGIPYELVGRNSLETELHCRAIAESKGYTLVHPYNDPLIIAGQGTVAREMLDHRPDLDAMIVPVGGGGLIAGVACYTKFVRPDLDIIGCQPLNSPEMVESIRTGSIITENISLPTLSDGTAGGMEPDSITYGICQDKVDEWALLTEKEIAIEIVEMIQSDQILIEGAAALPLAYLRKYHEKFHHKNVGVVISGKRISRKKLGQLLGNI